MAVTLRERLSDLEMDVAPPRSRVRVFVVVSVADSVMDDVWYEEGVTDELSDLVSDSIHVSLNDMDVDGVNESDTSDETVLDHVTEVECDKVEVAELEIFPDTDSVVDDEKLKVFEIDKLFDVLGEFE